jgi:hypothetical protein
MRLRWIGLAATGALLAACGAEPYAKNSAPQGVVAMEEARSAAVDMMADAVAGSPPPMPEQATRTRVVQQDPDVGGGQTQPPATAARDIAYEYNFTFAVPTGAMQALLASQRAACETAGPSRCYVVSSSLSGLGQDTTYGAMQLRASADWVAQFRAGLPEALKPYEAVLDASTETSEDLTVQLIDTSARLNSLKTMRDRLQALLADRPGRLSDLLELERELARVQGEIDSTESILAAMRQRVAMSLLTIGYQPRYSAVSESVWRPLGDAFASFLPRAAGSLAVFVSFIASILPWAVILGASLFILQLLWRLTFGRTRRAPRPRPPAAT